MIGYGSYMSVTTLCLNIHFNVIYLPVHSLPCVPFFLFTNRNISAHFFLFIFLLRNNVSTASTLSSEPAIFTRGKPNTSMEMQD